MEPTNRTARLAGALYVLLGIIAPFSLIYIPGRFLVKDDAAATAKKILEAESLFRLGIASELLYSVIVIFLVMVLYRLFNRVDKMQAWLLVIFGGLLSVPMQFLNVVNELAALTLLRGTPYLAAFSEVQRQSLAMLFLRLHGQTIVVEEIFWGLWLFPFGILIIRSRFIPKILGWLLLLNGLTYIVLSMTSLLGLGAISVLNRWAFITELGEVWVMLWLLIRGAKVQDHASDRL